MTSGCIRWLTRNYADEVSVLAETPLLWGACSAEGRCGQTRSRVPSCNAVHGTRQRPTPQPVSQLTAYVQSVALPDDAVPLHRRLQDVATQAIPTTQHQCAQTTWYALFYRFCFAHSPKGHVGEPVATKLCNGNHVLLPRTQSSPPLPHRLPKLRHRLQTKRLSQHRRHFLPVQRSGRLLDSRAPRPSQILWPALSAPSLRGRPCLNRQASRGQTHLLR